MKSRENVMYIPDVPYSEFSAVCRILNANNDWLKLAGKHMELSFSMIEILKREENPTKHLLIYWGARSHTVLELFKLLKRIENYECMEVLKPLVNPRYHSLIDSGEALSQRILDCEPNDGSTEDMDIGGQNFNQPRAIQEKAQKIIVNQTHQNGTADRSDRFEQTPSTMPLSETNNLLVPSPIPTSVALPVLQPVAGTSKKLVDVPFADSDTALPQVGYEELERATRSWSKDAILGKGGFGTVFRGNWKNTEVAIKRIEQRGPNTDESYIIQLQQSVRELKILNARRHDNILSLYAYSMGGDAPCLVYQYMPNGSLDNRLLKRQNSEALNWLQRHEIAKGTARGLQFLHTIGDKPLIHGDIKSANILLDKNFEPKIGDFGLAGEGSGNSVKVSRIQGTRPYLPDEFLLRNILSEKTDTYSFGIVLFELATGLAAYDHSRTEKKFLKDYMDSWEEKDLPSLIDESAGEEGKQVYDVLIALGKRCTNILAKHRPDMVKVFEEL